MQTSVATAIYHAILFLCDFGLKPPSRTLHWLQLGYDRIGRFLSLCFINEPSFCFCIKVEGSTRGGLDFVATYYHRLYQAVQNSQPARMNTSQTPAVKPFHLEQLYARPISRSLRVANLVRPTNIYRPTIFWIYVLNKFVFDFFCSLSFLTRTILPLFQWGWRSHSWPPF